MEAAVPYIIILAGLFAITAAVLNWDWFMNHRKARLWVRLFGRTGARAFYMILGLLISGLGVVMAMGLVDTPADG